MSAIDRHTLYGGKPPASESEVGGEASAVTESLVVDPPA